MSDLLPIERAQTASIRTGSRYELPGTFNGNVVFGLDRVLGRYFQFYSDHDGDPDIDEDHLGKTEMVALLREWGRWGSPLMKAIEAIMMDVEPSEYGLHGRQAKFPSGEKMTVEEVSKVVGPEFKEMNKNPPESVVKVRDQMTGKTADLLPIEEAMFSKGEDVPLEDLPSELQENVKNPPPEVKKLKKKMQEESMGSEDNLLPIESMDKNSRGHDFELREAAAGLYGYTKQTQGDIEGSVRKAQKRAKEIAKSAFERDDRVVSFLQAHAKRNGSSSAKLLLAALEEDGPRVASTERDSSEKVARGLYGHPAKTAKLGLSACGEFRLAMGEIAYDLHSRREAKFAQLTGFLQEHSKKARCGYSRMLLGCYPDDPSPVSEDGGGKKTAGSSSWNKAIDDLLAELKLSPKDEKAFLQSIEKKVESWVENQKKTAGIEKEIGAEVNGPVETLDSDEPWMKGEFTQQEFTELSKKQEDGTLGEKTAAMDEYMVSVRLVDSRTRKVVSKMVKVRARDEKEAMSRVSDKYRVMGNLFETDYAKKIEKQAAEPPVPNKNEVPDETPKSKDQNKPEFFGEKKAAPTPSSVSGWLDWQE